MVDEVHTKYVDWPLCVALFPLYDKSIEGGALCKLGVRLRVAAGGSLRFDYQHPAPQRIRLMGHPFRISAVKKERLV